jgi:large subunit ribosomal protein L24
MKKNFSTSWKASKQARKQRKYVAEAPLHIKQKLLSAHLSKDLRTKYKRRSFQIRKNDVVKVMNGEYKGKTGKISIIDLTKLRVAIEGIQITKKDGSKTNIFFRPSKLLITELSLEDNRRTASLNKEKKTEVKTEKKEAKK